MSTASKTIANQALSLSPEERAFVANAILQSLEDQPFKYEKEWNDEVQRRISDLENGNVNALSHDEFISKLK